MITYGVIGESAPKLYTCTPVSIVTDGSGASTAVCTIVEGVGRALTFVLRTGQLTSAEGTDQLNYLTPTIVPNTIRGAPENTGSTSYTGQKTEGDLVVFDVEHLPSTAAVLANLKVYYGQGEGPYATLCTFPTLGSYGGVAYISCTTQPGDGSGYRFVITALNQLSNVGTDVYNYKVAPTVISVSGCTNVGNATTECGTAGGTTIVINGENFGQDGLSVRVGAATCTSVVFFSPQRVSCVLPAGAGKLQGVTVIVGSLFSRAQPFVSYASAVVASVSGCSDVGSDTVSCARGGGTTLTVRGSNFGPSPALVLIGGVECTNVAANVANPHGQLTCTLASGTQTLRSVIIVQKGGSLTTGVPTVSYAQCTAGNYAPITQITCMPCQRGTYADVDALTACKNCAAGTFGSVTGLTSCTSCSAGSYSLVGSVVGAQNCTSCPAGQYNIADGSSFCSDCGLGTFNNATGRTQCASCPVGKYQNAAASTRCEECYPGTYYGFTGAVQCTNCPVGTATSQYGQSSCADCPAGSMAAAAGSTECTQCLQGTYSSSPRQGACASCDSGTYSNTSSLSSCYLCPVGRYVTKPGSLGATGCLDCQPGTFTNAVAQASCLVCAKGSQQPYSGRSVCSQCSAGYYSDDTTGTVTCSRCAAGYYAPSNGTVACLACGQGTYASGLGNSRCSSCVAGTVQPLSAQSSCTLCAIGSYQSNSGQAQCTRCDDGTFSNTTQSSVCMQCEKGKYAVRGSSSGASVCTSCAPGKYADLVGQSACFSCGAGSYSNEYGSAACQRCPAGQASTAIGATACNNCTAGQFAANTGSLTCTNCLSGTYGTNEGQTACQQW